MLSIVVPTLNEAENIPGLVEQINAELTVTYEVIFVDDGSEDDTVAVTEQLAEQLPVRVVSRAGQARDLSASVLDGIKASQYERIVVMDADHSHSPAVLPLMLKALEEKPDSFVLGSRYIEGGSFDRDWQLWRFLNSHVATLLALPLVRCSDPMSGFFAFSKAMLPSGLKPRGYKIALELMVRGEFSEIIELPIQFKDRAAGESKLNMKQQLNYLLHLRLLYLHRYRNFTEFVNFGLVGLSGFLVDVTCYYLLQFIGLEHLLARALSFWPAATSNWLLNRTTTFSERVKHPRIRQWMEFVASSMMGFTINWSVYYLLTTYVEFFDNYRLLAMVMGVICGSVFNFTASTLFVYSDKRSQGK